jgi:hypothetical protein
MNTTLEKKETYTAPWEESKWLFASSFLFLFPAILAGYHQLYSYCFILIITSFVSANYWRKATYSWRRNMDLVVSKMAFVVFVSKGYLTVVYYPYLITGYSGLILVCYVFTQSKKLWEKKDKRWVLYHFLFHVLLTYEQMIIIDSIRCID